MGWPGVRQLKIITVNGIVLFNLAQDNNRNNHLRIDVMKNLIFRKPRNIGKCICVGWSNIYYTTLLADIHADIQPSINKTNNYHHLHLGNLTFFIKFRYFL